MICTHELFLKMTLRLCLGFSLDLGLLFMPFCHVVHVLFALGLVFFSTKPRDWLDKVAFYDLRPGNTAVSILTAPEPTWGNMMPCTSLEIQRQRPRLKAFSLPSSRTSMCCSVPSATFHVTVRWSEPYTDNTHDLLLVVHSNHSSVTNITTCCALWHILRHTHQNQKVFKSYKKLSSP